MDTEKLIRKLSSTSKTKRDAACRELEGHPAEKVIPLLADLILSTKKPDVVEAGLNLLDRCGAVASMASHDTSGWYDKVKAHVSQFDKINAVLGERFLAYAFVLGIQIQALKVDPTSPMNTAVHFTLNDEVVQTLSLGDFRVRVVQALVYDHPVPARPSLPFDADTAVQVVGSKNLLLASLFDIAVEQILVGDLTPGAPRYLVRYRTVTGRQIAELKPFLELVRTGVRHDLAGIANEPFTLDLFAVPKAREAAEKGDHERVIAHLASWPGLLSVLHRTPVARQLDEEQLSLIGEGVSLLGEALEARERDSWSLELFKLGLLMVREGPSAARLLWNLGRVKCAAGEFGVAIGHLRRALALGYPEEAVLPLLGRAFLKQGKVVAATALLETAAARQMTADTLQEDLKEARKILTAAKVEWSIPPVDPGVSS